MPLTRLPFSAASSIDNNAPIESPPTYTSSHSLLSASNAISTDLYQSRHVVALRSSMEAQWPANSWQATVTPRRAITLPKCFISEGVPVRPCTSNMPTLLCASFLPEHITKPLALSTSSIVKGVKAASNCGRLVLGKLVFSNSVIVFMRYHLPEIRPQ